MVRTVGVEEELHLLSADTGRLAPHAPRVLSRLPAEGFSAELQRSTVETNTPVCATLSELHRHVVAMRAAVRAAASHAGLAVAACGTAPLALSSDFELTAKGRYGRMQQDYRLLVDEHLVCGLQVHVGVDDRELAVRLMRRVAPALPTLLALSASSPFWASQDTGYASTRTMVWQRWPTAGRPPHVGSAAEYDRLLSALIASKVISDAKMAYFDVRPSSHVPTLELRVCDSTPSSDDVALIAGLFRAVVDQAAEAEQAGAPLCVRAAPLYQAAMWRAARSGLAADLLDVGCEPVPRPAGEVVKALLRQVRPQLEAAQDWDDVHELCAAALRRGCSADRQRARLTDRGRLSDVVQLVVEETGGGKVAGPRARTRWTVRYRDHPADEAVAANATVRATYRPIFEVLERFDAAELDRRITQASRLSQAADLAFRVDGRQRVFPVDVVPRVVPAHEWSVLAAGLTQRARAIEAFLEDVYGPAAIVSDGVIPAPAIFEGPGWRKEAHLLPEGVVRAPVIGFDLVRDGLGGWRVLEDNVRVPSGVGYAIAVRRIMQAVMPELYQGVPVRAPDSALDLVGATLRAASLRPARVVALLSEGADNSAWFEHRLLAEEAGLVLAQPGEVETACDWVVVGGQRVDVVYLRIGVELAELTDASGRRVGEMLIESAKAGRTVLANAPGNGIADDKSMYCRLADLIGYYLGERPLLDPVPTYCCADPGERASVLERLDELVTKPVGGYGGAGVLVGPEATAAELDLRRRQIAADPALWVAQETVALSTLPTLVGGRLVPRHVDLRAFVYLTGTGPGQATLADLALTRMAPEGTMVVNSSRGGGAKDTWIQAEGAGPGEGGVDVRPGR